MLYTLKKEINLKLELLFSQDVKCLMNYITKFKKVKKYKNKHSFQIKY